jgi:hypothetical protein
MGFLKDLSLFPSIPPIEPFYSSWFLIDFPSDHHFPNPIPEQDIMASEIQLGFIFTLHYLACNFIIHAPFYKKFILLEISL